MKYEWCTAKRLFGERRGLSKLSVVEKVLRLPPSHRMAVRVKAPLVRVHVSGSSFVCVVRDLEFGIFLNQKCGKWGGLKFKPRTTVGMIRPNDSLVVFLPTHRGDSDLPIIVSNVVFQPDREVSTEGAA